MPSNCSTPLMSSSVRRLSARTCQRADVLGHVHAVSEAAKLTRAPHASRPSTPVTVRYSNSTGVPTIPDNDPKRSSPRGMATRFHLAERQHANIIARSTDGFPVRTGKELPGVDPRRHSLHGGPGPRRSDRSWPPIRTPSGLSKRPNRSRPVSRGRPFSPLLRLSSPMRPA